MGAAERKFFTLTTTQHDALTDRQGLDQGQAHENMHQSAHTQLYRQLSLTAFWGTGNTTKPTWVDRGVRNDQ